MICLTSAIVFLADNSPAPIREAMSKIQPKVAKKSEQPAATASVVKKPVDVNDFFGVTPIHRTESRQPGKVNGSKVGFFRCDVNFKFFILC